MNTPNKIPSKGACFCDGGIETRGVAPQIGNICCLLIFHGTLPCLVLTGSVHNIHKSIAWDFIDGFFIVLIACPHDLIFVWWGTSMDNPQG